MSTAAIRKKLKKIWCSILGTETVSGDVNFFDAGGNSLLLAELKKQTDQEFGTDISIVELMTYTNISSLAEYISSLIS